MEITKLENSLRNQIPPEVDPSSLDKWIAVSVWVGLFLLVLAVVFWMVQRLIIKPSINQWKSARHQAPREAENRIKKAIPHEEKEKEVDRWKEEEQQW